MTSHDFVTKHYETTTLRLTLFLNALKRIIMYRAMNPSKTYMNSILFSDVDQYNTVSRTMEEGRQALRQVREPINPVGRAIC